MKIYCHNVRVWTRDRDKSSEWYWKNRMKRIRALLMDKYDVLCLQELSYPANHYIPKSYRRVCPSISHPIYVRKGIKTRKHRFHFRWDECEINLDGQWMLFINVHLHWDEKIFARCMEKIRKRINKAILEEMPYVACGDWNMSYSFLASELGYKAYIYPWDTYTFKNSETGRESRIDYYAVDMGHPADWENDIFVGDILLSDHRPIRLLSKKQ